MKLQQEVERFQSPADWAMDGLRNHAQTSELDFGCTAKTTFLQAALPTSIQSRGMHAFFNSLLERLTDRELEPLGLIAIAYAGNGLVRVERDSIAEPENSERREPLHGDAG